MSQGFTKDYPQTATGSVQCSVNGTPVASTSGTSIDFTIPSGVKTVKVLYDGLSTSGTSTVVLRLGDSTSVKSTGYQGNFGFFTTTGQSALNFTDGFALNYGSASAIRQGKMQFDLLSSSTNTWIASSNDGTNISTTRYVHGGAGSLSLTSELTTVRITTQGGTDTFDAGTINIMYDNPDLVIAETVYLEGKVVQVVKTEDGELASGTTTMPRDDTIPQNTEGVEFLTCSITPTDATNLLRIDVVLHCNNSTVDDVTVAIFQDSTASALAALANSTVADRQTTIPLTHWMTAGTTSSTTFKVRAGSNGASTLRLNGKSVGGRIYGGVAASSITITEYKT